MTAITEGSQLIGESGKTYLAVGPLGQANVWTAVETSNLNNIVVIKSPTSDDDAGASWPHFQHEMIMHELFKDCDGIRKLVDRVPPVKARGAPPMLVLEIFETTLWQARAKRPFSRGEIKAVCRGILRGLQQVHSKGLVYADLKMPNVMISGFDVSTPGDGSKLVAKLGDLGIVMPPCNGKVQPVAYRAPEIYFKGEIAPPADIWAFGLVCCHLLEAQIRFSKTGLYDDLETSGGSMPEREQAMRYAIADDYDIKNVDYYKGCSLPYQHEGHPAGNQWTELQKRGIDAGDIKFLQWILESDPTKRPTAAAILASPWFAETKPPRSSHINVVDGAMDINTTSQSGNPKADSQISNMAPTVVSPHKQTTKPITTSIPKPHPIPISSSTTSTQPAYTPRTAPPPVAAQGLGAILAGLPGGNNANPLTREREASNSPAFTSGTSPPSKHTTASDANKRLRLSVDITGNDSLASAVPVASRDVSNAAVVAPQVAPVGGATKASSGTYLSYR